MINHMRTLIVNRPAGDLNTYVDPSFSPVELPATQKELHGVLFPGQMTGETADLVMKHYDGYLSLPEFRRYLTAFDERLTYAVDNSLDDESVDVPEFHEVFSRVASVVTRRLLDVFPSKGEYAAQLSELKGIWTSSPYDHEKMAAALFALAFVTEERRNG